MLTTRELRIGNLLRVTKTKKVIEVDSILGDKEILVKDGVKFISYKIDELEGIKITTEVLDSVWFFGDFMTKYNIPEQIYIGISDKYCPKSPPMFGSEIQTKYLHQIQNVYYFINGCELSILEKIS